MPPNRALTREASVGFKYETNQAEQHRAYPPFMGSRFGLIVCKNLVEFTTLSRHEIDPRLSRMPGLLVPKRRHRVFSDIP